MIRAILLASVVVAVATQASAQDHATHQQSTHAVFEHYEQVRVALSADDLSNIGTHAKALASSVESVGGGNAKRAADQLAAATSLDAARQHFGTLSAILVPLFQKQGIQGTYAFMCPMKKQPWMQRGDKVQNPYYGKAMPTCGTPLSGKQQ